MKNLATSLLSFLPSTRGRTAVVAEVPEITGVPQQTLALLGIGCKHYSYEYCLHPRLTYFHSTGLEGRPLAQLRGPFGLWSFPILSIIMLILERLVALRSGSHVQSGPRPRMKTISIVRDREGRISEITTFYDY